MADDKKTNVDELYKKFQMGDYDKLNQSVKEGVKAGKLNEGLAGRILKMAADKMEEEGKSEDNFQTYQDMKTYSNVYGDRYKLSKGLGPKKAEQSTNTEEKKEEPKKEETVEEKKSSILEGFKQGLKALGNTIIPTAGAAPFPEGSPQPTVQSAPEVSNFDAQTAGNGVVPIQPADINTLSPLVQETVNPMLEGAGGYSAGEIQQSGAPADWDTKQVVQEPVQNDIVDVQQMSPQEEMGNAISNMGAIEYNQKIQESKALQAQQKEIERIEKQRLEQEQKVKQAIDEEELNFKETMDAVGSKGIDPNRYVNNMSTGNKILAGIAIALSSRGDKGNRALDILNDTINKDIEAQKQDILNLKDKAAAKKSLMSDLYTKLGDINKAADYAKLAMLQSTKNQIDIMAAKSGSATALEKAAMQKSILDQQMQAEKLKLMEKYADRAEAYSITKDTDPRSIVNEKLAEKFVPGVGLASTKDNAIKLSEKKVVLDDINNSLDQLKEIGSKNYSSLNLKDRELVDQKIGELIGKLRLPITGPGPLTDTEREFIRGLIGDPTKIWSIKDIQLSKINSLQTTLNKSFANEAKTRGVVGFDTQDTIGFKPKK